MLAFFAVCGVAANCLFVCTAVYGLHLAHWARRDLSRDPRLRTGDRAGDDRRAERAVGVLVRCGGVRPRRRLRVASGDPPLAGRLATRLAGRSGLARIKPVSTMEAAGDRGHRYCVLLVWCRGTRILDRGHPAFVPGFRPARDQHRLARRVRDSALVVHRAQGRERRRMTPPPLPRGMLIGLGRWRYSRPPARIRPAGPGNLARPVPAWPAALPVRLSIPLIRRPPVNGPVPPPHADTETRLTPALGAANLTTNGRR